jgi:Aspartyl/Asparaginyl beta-hydroxylase
MIIKLAQLKQRFDVIQMQREVNSLESELWKPHYNLNHYEGIWTTLQLRSINGNIENNISIQGSSLQQNMRYENTVLFEKCPYLQAVVNFFKCKKMSVRLMNLSVGAIIKEHTDYDMNFEKGEARFHIPVFTNPDVSFFIEDEKISMNEGECWYLNLSLKHRVDNSGRTNRIHLVVDCKVNDWLRNLLLAETAIRATIEEKEEVANYSVSDKIKIIQELRLMGTTLSNDMAEKLEAKDE